MVAITFQSNDGFTLYYEPDGSDTQNNKQMLSIANHHRRMRNLQEITKI